MNVEQMSVADLLREGKQAMALSMGSVGPETRDRWAAVTAEIDLRLSVGDLDEGELVGSGFVPEWRLQNAVQQRDKAGQERDWAKRQIKNNSTNLQFVQDEFNKNHPALVGELGSDLSRGAMLLWAWAKENGHV